MKFAVNDRVISTLKGDCTYGKRGTVIEIMPTNSWPIRVQFDSDPEGVTGLFYEHELKPFEYKVGDKVYLPKEIGTIVKIYDNLKNYKYGVRCPDGGLSFFSDEELTIVREF